MLDLDPGPGAWAVRFSSSFSDNPLHAEGRQLIEPGPRDLKIIGLHPEDQHHTGVHQYLLQLPAPFGERRTDQVPASEAEEIGQDEVTGLGTSQATRSPSSAAVSSLQGLKVQSAAG